MINEKKYKVMIALSSFILSITCLTATTFAWYAIANETFVDNIKISLRGDDKIEIGLKAPNDSLKDKYTNENGEWVGDIYFIDQKKSMITEQMLLDFEYITGEEKMIPVTSAHKNLWYDEKAEQVQKPVLYKMPGSSNIRGDVSVIESEIKDYYYSFEFYVRASNPVYVFLEGGTYITPNIDKNKETAEKYNLNVDQLNNIDKYMRCSISGSNSYMIYEANPSIKDKKYVETNYFGRLDISPFDGYYDYDLNTKKEILYGSYLNENKIVYDESGRTNGNDFDQMSGGFEANTHQKAIPIDIEKSIKNGIEGEVEKTIKPEEIKDINHYREDLSNSICYLGKDSIEKIYVNVYCEGWDRDCNANSSLASFNFNLSLGCEYPDNYND